MIGSSSFPFYAMQHMIHTVPTRGRLSTHAPQGALAFGRRPARSSSAIAKAARSSPIYRRRVCTCSAASSRSCAAVLACFRCCARLASLGASHAVHAACFPAALCRCGTTAQPHAAARHGCLAAGAARGGRICAARSARGARTAAAAAARRMPRHRLRVPQRLRGAGGAGPGGACSGGGVLCAAASRQDARPQRALARLSRLRARGRGEHGRPAGLARAGAAQQRLEHSMLRALC